MSKEVSIPIAFVSLLHLANEKVYLFTLQCKLNYVFSYARILPSLILQMTWQFFHITLNVSVTVISYSLIMKFRVFY